MASTIETYPRVGQYMGVSRDTSVGRLRIILYAALNANGLIGPEFNGIAVLDEKDKQVVCDGINRESSGYFGPSTAQTTMWESLVKMAKDKPTTFLTFVNDQPGCRTQIKLPDAEPSKPKPKKAKAAAAPSPKPSEIDESLIPFRNRYPELEAEAQRISRETSAAINTAAANVTSDMPYKAQGILERVVRLLEAKI